MTRPPARRPRGSARARASAMGALTTLGVAAGLALLAALFLYFGPGPAAPTGASTTVILRPGAGVSEIASDLKDAHVIGSGAAFVAAAEVTGAAHKLKAGEYAFASHASLATITSAIAEGRIVPHFVTIPEGVTSQMVMDILSRADYLTGVAPAPPEGAVLPETYEVRRGDDRAAVLRRMMDARDRVLSGLWAHRSDGLPYTSPEEAVTLASIVEKETARPEERRHIAGVFLNRMKAGMRLQSDPTTIYGLTGGRPLGHGLTQSELESNTPYNTYLVAGLPPTPIANPGEASLAAVLDPLPTDDLYFVADGAGGHAFSATLAAHDANVEHWRAIESAHHCQKPAPVGAKGGAC